MTETRAYNRAELDLLPPSVLLRLIDDQNADIYNIGNKVIALVICKDCSLTMPIRTYAAAVVERFIGMCCEIIEGETVEHIDYIPEAQHLIIRTAMKSIKCHELYAFVCPTNPFQGLTNPDGTQVTSVTREVLDAWKRGEVV